LAALWTFLASPTSPLCFSLSAEIYGILLAKYKNRYLSLRGQTSAFLAALPRSGKGVVVVLMNLIYFKKRLSSSK